MSQVVYDFISEETRVLLLEWAQSIRPLAIQNGEACDRWFVRLTSEIKSEIINSILESIKTEFNTTVEDTGLGHFVTFNYEGASIPQHKDFAAEGYSQHVRYNIVIQAPEAGGQQVQGDEITSIANGMLLRLIASDVSHSTTPVVGQIPRIVLQFGFQELGGV